MAKGVQHVPAHMKMGPKKAMPKMMSGMGGGSAPASSGGSKPAFGSAAWRAMYSKKKKG